MDGRQRAAGRAWKGRRPAGARCGCGCGCGSCGRRLQLQQRQRQWRQLRPPRSSRGPASRGRRRHGSSGCNRGSGGLSDASRKEIFFTAAGELAEEIVTEGCRSNGRNYFFLLSWPNEKARSGGSLRASFTTQPVGRLHGVALLALRPRQAGSQLFPPSGPTNREQSARFSRWCVKRSFSSLSSTLSHPCKI